MEDKYAKIFSRRDKLKSKRNDIKSIQVADIENMTGVEIIVKLWDETLTRASLPRWCCESEDKDFIFYYVNKVLAPILMGHDPLNQKAIDKILDQQIEDVSLENNLEKLARNVNWAISVAVCKAGAYCKGMALYKYIAKLAKGIDKEFDSDFKEPTPSFNITNGELCSKNRLADQHLLILPSRANSFPEAIHIIKKIYDSYFKVPTVEIDDQHAGKGSYSHTFSTKDVKNCAISLEKVIADLGYEDKVSIGVNIGASKFYKHRGTYRLNLIDERRGGSHEITAGDLKDVYEKFLREFHFETVEDPFHLDDRCYSSQLVNEFRFDDVIMDLDPVTDLDTLLRMISDRACNGFVLKVGRMGSVTKCIGFVLFTKVHEWAIYMSSHDSCETSDPFIADLCVGLCLEKLKIGVSCITNDCNICNRVRELTVERAEYVCRNFPIRTYEQVIKRFRYGTVECVSEAEYERTRKANFKMSFFGLLTRMKARYAIVSKARNSTDDAYSRHSDHHLTSYVNYTTMPQTLITRRLVTSTQAMHLWVAMVIYFLGHFQQLDVDPRLWFGEDYGDMSEDKQIS